MNKIRQQTLDNLLNALYDFYEDCNISPKCSEDLKRYWIIDKQEDNEIEAVLDLLIDCGARLTYLP